MKKFEPEQYTKYEKARILGPRALQIRANAPILLKISKEKLEELNYDPIKIAELEFEAGILPITVKRPLPKKIERKLPEPKEIIKKEEKIKETKEEIPEEKAIVEEAEEKEMEEEEMTEEAIAEEIEAAETEEELEE